MRLLFAAILCVRPAAAPQLRAAMAIPTLLTAPLLAPLAPLHAAEAPRLASKSNILILLADDTIGQR